MSEIFRFKRFSISHERSSMKVGIDSIILGSWADVSKAKSIIDIGTGCGILSLMCAQRNLNAKILGIDIDRESVAEASENFKLSPWSSRLSSRLSDFEEIKEETFDLIISNPPFFNSGVSKFVNAREKARHQGKLNPCSLLNKGKEILTDDGKIVFILPAEQENSTVGYAESIGLTLSNVLKIKGRADLPVKRVILEFSKKSDDMSKQNNNLIQKILIIEERKKHPTEQFKEICRDFYLNF